MPLYIQWSDSYTLYIQWPDSYAPVYSVIW